MSPTYFLAVVLAFLSVQTFAEAQSCNRQRTFLGGFSNPLVCAGAKGGSEITIGALTITFRVRSISGPRPSVAGFPNEVLPDFLRLVVARRPTGEIQLGMSFMQKGSKKYFSRSSEENKKNFRLYYNILQVLVRQFETGNCPIINKGKKFPELASVRGGLLSLASVFNVDDCSGGLV